MPLPGGEHPSRVLFAVVASICEVDAHVDRVGYRAAGNAMRREPEDDKVGALVEKGTAEPLEEIIANLFFGVLRLDFLPERLLLLSNRVEVTGFGAEAERGGFRDLKVVGAEDQLASLGAVEIEGVINIHLDQVHLISLAG